MCHSLIDNERSATGCGESPRIGCDLSESKRWHVMRATYGRALKARDYLKEKGILTFVPLRYAAGRQGLNMVKRLVPVMPNIIFVYAEPQVVQKVKLRADYLQYMMNRRTGEKLYVAERDMERFIAVCGTHDERLLWLQYEDVPVNKGERVRITGGVFNGQEGVLLKVKGAREKRVVVVVEGVMAVALAAVHPSLIEKI